MTCLKNKHRPSSGDKHRYKVQAYASSMNTLSYQYKTNILIYYQSYLGRVTISVEYQTQHTCPK